MKKIVKDCLRGNKKNIFLLMILMIFQVLISLLIPIILQKYVDNMNMKVYNKILIIILLYLGFNIFGKILNVCVKYFAENTGWKIFSKMRCKILDIIIDYDENFYNKNSTGQLLEYLERDINIMFKFFKEKMLEIIINVGVMFGIIIVFFKENIIIGVVFLVYIVMAFVLIFMSIKIDKEVLKDYQIIQSFNLGKYGEWYEARKDIFLFRKFDYIREKIKKLDNEYRSKEIRAQVYLYRIWGITLFMSTFASVICLLIAGYLYFYDLLSIGIVYLLYTYSEMLKNPFENFQSQLQMILNTRVAYSRLNEVLCYSDEVSDGSKGNICDKPEIIINDVTYSYRDDKKIVLNKLSLHIRSGEVLGIMGHSGCGKSTLCKLLCKLIESKKGEILIDGIDIKEFAKKEIRGKITYISTAANLFRGTIKENLTVFNDEIKDEDIYLQLEKYKLLSYFKELGLEKLEQDITELQLSDGQKQLISFARIIYLESAVVILDEATSKIDEKLMEKIKYVLNLLRKDKTIIIVSHNRETMDICDEIICFQEGKIQYI